MAEKKEHKLVNAETGEALKQGEKPAKVERPEMKEAAPVGNATGLRIGAICLWVVAILFEVLALLVVLGKLNLKFMPTMWQLIIFIVLDLVCVVIGSQLWKKANHIKPASEKNKVKFWLWNNLGLIVTIVAFVPLVILILTNKNMDKKTKVIATVVAVIALLIGGASSIDYNPVSQEQQEAAMEAITDTVYWAPFGKVYHTHEDCQALNQSDALTYGTVEQAIAANRTRLCSFCAHRDEITGVVTDDADISDYVEPGAGE
ncbi:MAG: hypothetical protein IJ744_09580 [Lachnospiraceae bacterium]|nr:hypothetical protein [Lachnospiraceae bacterium]